MSTGDLLEACDIDAIRVILNKNADNEAAGFQNYKLPDRVTNLQAIAVFAKWAKANPEHWHEPAAENFINAVAEGFCID